MVGKSKKMRRYLKKKKKSDKEGMKRPNHPLSMEVGRYRGFEEWL